MSVAVDEIGLAEVAREPRCGLCRRGLAGASWCHAGWRLFCLECGHARSAIDAWIGSWYGWRAKAEA